MERTNIELFYRAPLDRAMIEFDSHGRTRGAIRNFERLRTFLCEPPAPVSDFAARVRANEINFLSRFLNTNAERTNLLHLLLASTPIIDGQKFSLIEYQQSDLEDFAKLVRIHKPAIETLLELEVRADSGKKPMMMVGKILGVLGLSHTHRRQKVKGSVINFYRLDEEKLNVLHSLVERRDTKDGWKALREIYGWTGKDAERNDE